MAAKSSAEMGSFMLNYIWAFLIFISVVYGTIAGSLPLVTNGILDSAKDAVELCITMLGVMSLWTGLMEIAQRSGIIKSLTRKIMPLMHWLFPDIPTDHEAMSHICTNMIANFLGLGWAATPAGLRAMQSLAQLNKDHPESASNAMCTFLIINISSIQLIPVNIIAYRSQYGSANPAAIIVPAILATTVSTAVAILFCRIMNKTKS